MVQYVRIRYRVRAVDTKFSVHSRARGRRYLTIAIGIIHSIYYMLDTVKSAMEFISSSLQVLRDSAVVHVGAVRYPRSM